MVSRLQTAPLRISNQVRRLPTAWSHLAKASVMQKKDASFISSRWEALPVGSAKAMSRRPVRRGGMVVSWISLLQIGAVVMLALGSVQANLVPAASRLVLNVMASASLVQMAGALAQQSRQFAIQTVGQNPTRKTH